MPIDKGAQNGGGDPWATFASLILLVTGACWGCIGLFIRPLDEMGFSSFQLCWLRSVLTALMFLAIVLVRKRELLHIELRDVWCFMATGLFSVVFFSICYYTTISLTSLSVAAVLMYTAPAFVLFISHFLFGDSITPVKVLAVVLIIVGCVFVSGLVAGVPQLPLLGLLTGLGSGIGYASYSIFTRIALNPSTKATNPLPLRCGPSCLPPLVQSLLGAALLPWRTLLRPQSPSLSLWA